LDENSAARFMSFTFAAFCLTGLVQGAAGHGFDQVAPIVCAIVGIVHGLDGVSRRLRGLRKGLRAWLLSRKHPLDLDDPARLGLGAADAQARLDHAAVLEPVGRERHGDREVADAPAEFIEAEMRVGRQQGEACLHQQLVFLEVRRHDAVKEIRRRDEAPALPALRHHLGAERRRHQAPLRRRVRIHQAAAEGAAGADRVMRDVAHHAREQKPERPIRDRAIERRMPHAGADRKLAVHNRDAIKLRDAVDVDQVRRAGQPECHGGDQALPAGQHATVRRRDRGQQGNRLVHGLGRMVLKGRRFHRRFTGQGKRPAVPYLGL
jgi:hypothetical protein